VHGGGPYRIEPVRPAAISGSAAFRKQAVLRQSHRGVAADGAPSEPTAAGKTGKTIDISGRP
jgi:hypothetical protein